MLLRRRRVRRLAFDRHQKSRRSRLGQKRQRNLQSETGDHCGHKHMSRFDPELIVAFSIILHAPERALAPLSQVLDIEPPTFLGWMIGVDPLLTRLRGRPEFTALLMRLAERAA